LAAEDAAMPFYSTFGGSLGHVYLVALGEFGYMGDYPLGDAKQQTMLWLLFVVATFILMIHLLNMLVAIMGEAFARLNEVKDMQQIRSHLRFVLDNQFMDPIKDKEKISYLITAF
jgi:hypothetical protein